jgi:hypothetical protein
MLKTRWNWREKEKEGRPKDPSQETKKKESQDQTSLKQNGAKNGRPEEKNFDKKQVSPSIQRVYPLSK